MKKMKKTVAIITAAVILFSCFAGCAASTPASEQAVAETITLDSVIDGLNEERKAKLEQPLSFTGEDFGIIKPGEVKEFTQAEVDSLLEFNGKDHVTLDEALEDVNMLFRILKSSYGGYTYFGGDDVFLAAKDEIVRTLKLSPDKNSIESGYLTYLMTQKLAFMEDTHFMLGLMSPPYEEKYLFTDWDELDFSKDENGYYTVHGGDKWYLSKDDEQYMHLTVNEDGSIVYGLFGLAALPSELPSQLRLKTALGQGADVTVDWVMVRTGTSVCGTDNIHVLTEKDGVKVSGISILMLDGEKSAPVNDFINEAKELRDEDSFILDLRGNPGGDTAAVDFFLYNLTGSLCEFPSQTMKRYSRLNKSHDKAYNNMVGGADVYAGYEGIDFYDENKELVDSWYKESVEKSKKAKLGETLILNNMETEWCDRDGTIYVLIDKNTGSAAEYFLYKLSTVKNVVIIGSNSNGCLLTADVNAVSYVYLPNSGIRVYYGQMLLITDKMKGYDANGWMPDIIPRNEDALDTALTLIKNR